MANAFFCKCIFQFISFSVLIIYFICLFDFFSVLRWKKFIKVSLLNEIKAHWICFFFFFEVLCIKIQLYFFIPISCIEEASTAQASLYDELSIGGFILSKKMPVFYLALDCYYSSFHPIYDASSRGAKNVRKIMST